MSYLDGRRFWHAVLAAILVPLALVAYWPSPVDQPVQGLLTDVLAFLHRYGIPPWFNYKLVEAAANVALFVPMGFVSALAFPAMPWWQIGMFGFAISGCMEVGQLLFLHNRFATPVDLVTNMSGAVIGALLVHVVANKSEARRLSAAGLRKSL